MSNRLGGKQGTAYLGTNAIQPPDYTFTDRDPTIYDVNNVSLGDLWLNQSSNNLFALVSLARSVEGPGSVAKWAKLETSGSSTGSINTITGSDNIVVGPNTAANINIVSGIDGLTFNGNASTNTLTLNSDTGYIVESITGNNGGPILPVNGTIHIVGDDVGITITGDALTNTLTASLIGGGGAADEFITDDDMASLPIGGVLHIKAGPVSGSSVLFTSSSNIVQLNVTDANNNTMVALAAGNNSITGTYNNALGTNAGHTLTSGSNNTFVGKNSGLFLSTGSNNTLLGNGSGSIYTSTESNNICIGSFGVITESNVLRIGDSTATSPVTKSFIGGIRGVTPATTDGIPVFIGSTGQLGTIGSGGTTLISTLTGSTSGGAVSPTAGNINIAAGTGITVVGNPGTSTLTITSTGGSSGINTATGNSGGAVSSSGGNIFIVGDGTTANVVGNPGTNTITISSIGGGGGGAASFPTDSGTATESGSVLSILTGLSTLNSGSSVSFSAPGTSNTVQLNVSDSNGNTIVGNGAGKASISGINNTVFGKLGGASLTTGTLNIIVGKSAGATLTTGASNIIIGTTAGTAYTSSESSNVLINSAGLVSESNCLRIGYATGTSSGQLNKAFIAGIRGITPATTDGIPVFIGSTGQLGTVGSGGTTLISTLTGSTSGGAVGPSAGNLNIAAGSGITVVGNPGSSTLTISATGGATGVNTLTANTGGAVASFSGNINLVGDGTTINIVGNPGTNTLTVSTTGGAGNVAFFAYPNSTDIPNLTGDGTIIAAVPYNTTLYNIGGGFNTSTNLFTAPVAGIYTFDCTIAYYGLLNPNYYGYILMQIAGRANRVYIGQYGAMATTTIGFTGLLQVGGSISSYMNIGDTAQVATYVYGGTKTVGINGGPSTGSGTSYFCGQLI